jgi:hypothetical protein
MWRPTASRDLSRRKGNAGTRFRWNFSFVYSLFAQRRGFFMVARSRIHCLVVSVPAWSDRFDSQGVLARNVHARDVLPWADPYVAGLIKKLQDEVREERRFQSLVRHYRPAPGSSPNDSADDGMLYAQ